MSHVPTRGFLLGKFMPPHQGHLFLCRAAAQSVHELTILVCSTDDEPIPGEFREQWMRALLPECRVLRMHRNIPQEPKDHPDFWAIWKGAIREFHPEPIDAVFGSEAYIFRLASELGGRPIVIDPDREIHKVSGSMIRAEPRTYWASIPSPVRPYFQKRICILGPESTGKSTLAARLGSEFYTLHMPEYGRTYDAWYRQGTGWKEEDFIHLAQTHAAMRQALAPSAGYLLFEDTDALQTEVWARELGCIFDRSTLRDSSLAHHYLLLSPEVFWHDDGTRYFSNQDVRVRFFESCKQRLRENGCAYSIVRGSDWETRRRTAHAHVLEFLEDAR